MEVGHGGTPGGWEPVPGGLRTPAPARGGSPLGTISPPWGACLPEALVCTSGLVSGNVDRPRASVSQVPRNSPGRARRVPTRTFLPPEFMWDSPSLQKHMFPHVWAQLIQNHPRNLLVIGLAGKGTQLGSTRPEAGGFWESSSWISWKRPWPCCSVSSSGSKQLQPVSRPASGGSPRAKNRPEECQDVGAGAPGTEANAGSYFPMRPSHATLPRLCAPNGLLGTKAWAPYPSAAGWF